MERKKAFCIALLVGVGICCVGYLAMLMFWLNYIGDKTIPGFFDYRAATWGDGLCLSLLVASFVYYYLRASERNRHRVALGGGIAMALLGAGVQVSWLLDKNIKPNWTIPYAGHFTVAGWYHAVYFAAMFGIIAFFMICFCSIRRSELKKLSAMGDDVIAENLDSLGRFNELLIVEFFVVFAGTLYCILHFVDDYAERYSIETISVFVSLFVCVVFGFVLLATRKFKLFGTIGFIKELFMVFAGGIVACEISHLIIGITHKYVFLGVICGLFAFGFLFLYYGISEALVNLIGVPLVIPCLFFLAHNPGLVMGTRVVFIILFLLWPVLFLMTFWDRIRAEEIKGDQYLKSMIGSCEIFQIAVFLLPLFMNGNREISSNWVNCFFNMGLLWVMLYFIMITFRMIRNSEEIEYRRVSGDRKSVDEGALVKTDTYASIIAVAIAGICLEVRVLQGATSSTSKNQLFRVGLKNNWMLFLTFVLLVIAGIVVKGVLLRKRNLNEKKLNCGKCIDAKECSNECRTESPLFYGFVLLSFALIIFFAQVTFGASSAFKFEENPLWIYVFGSLICQVIGNSIFSCESYYSNTYYVRGYLCGTGKIARAYKATVAMMGPLSMISLAAIWGSIMMDTNELGPDVMQLIVAVFLSALVLVGMPVLFAYFQIRRLPERSLEFVNGNPIAEVAKDCTLGFIAFSLAGILPTYIVRYSAAMSMADQTVILITYAFSFLLELVVLLEFCERNNRRHYKTLYDAMCRFKESDEPEIAKMQYEEQIKNLRGHLKWQIFIAIAATWLYYPPLKLVLWIKDQVQKAAGNASGKDDELL